MTLFTLVLVGGFSPGEGLILLGFVVVMVLAMVALLAVIAAYQAARDEITAWRVRRAQFKSWRQS